MTALREGALRAFPVQFLRYQVASGHIPHARTHAERIFAQSINFADSFGQGRNAGRDTHNAIDIYGPRGLRIVSATEGTVVTTWRVGGEEVPGVGLAEDGYDGGNFVTIVDTAGLTHYYSHLQDHPRVKAGMPVTPGHLLGYLGATGNANGIPHLHYQVSQRTETGALRHFLNPYAELARLAAPWEPERRGATRLLIYPSAGGPSGP